MTVYKRAQCRRQATTRTIRVIADPRGTRDESAGLCQYCGSCGVVADGARRQEILLKQRTFYQATRRPTGRTISHSTLTLTTVPLAGLKLEIR